MSSEPRVGSSNLSGRAIFDTTRNKTANTRLASVIYRTSGNPSGTGVGNRRFLCWRTCCDR